jgi:hypothetical protein
MVQISEGGGTPMIGRILILVLLSSAAAVPIKAQATSPDDGFSLPRLAQAPQLAQFGNRKGGNKGERKMKRRGEMGGGFGSGGGMAVAEPCDRVPRQRPWDVLR